MYISGSKNSFQNMRIPLLMSIMLVFFSSTLLAQEAMSKKDQKNQERQEVYSSLQNLAKDQTFEFNANTAYPQKGGRVELTTRDNLLKLADGRIVAELPYFGRAYSAAGYGESGGIQIEGEYSDYNVQMNDKKRIVTVKFSASSDSENYTCTLTMSSLSNISLYIQSNRRQGMRYQGAISLD